MAHLDAIPLLSILLVAAASALPIDAPRIPVTDTVQGTRITDPYRWLEHWSDPKVQAWSSAENARARTYLDSLPHREQTKDELTRLIKATSPSYFDLQSRGPLLFAIYRDPSLQQPTIVVLTSTDPTTLKTVLDPNLLDPKGLTAVDWFVASPDGSKIAVSLSESGSEEGTLHVYDVATGKDVEAPIPRVQFATAGGSLAWNASGKGFWYTRYPGPETPEAERHFNLQVYYHVLGTDSTGDPLALGRKNGLERISEIFLDNRFALPQVMAMVQRGDGNIWAFYVLAPEAPPIQVGTYGDGIVYATFGPDGAIYGISRKKSSNGEIIRLAKASPGGLPKAPVVVPPSEVAILSGGAGQHQADLAFAPGHLFVRDIVGGPDEVRIFGLEGAPKGKLPLPEIASNSEIVPLSDGGVLYDVTTYLKPLQWLRWDPSAGKATETALRVTSPISYADSEVRRVFATSRDGTKVPVNIILKRNTKLDGTHPVLLYGYGGYGISEEPHFLGPTQRLWLDAGGIYAIANIRGGAEYGERWHREGMLTHKQNVFDDFAAAGQYLIDHGYTSHQKLALLGGSNGGLLMGAMVTQHPSLARAVVSEVGIYDMLRVELDPNGAFNTTEFGSVKDPVQFKALYGYSPYHHVRKGTAYPAVLMTTGATDHRVNPMQSRKMVASLQWATSSGLPILLRTSSISGHGIGSSLDERIALQTDVLSFLFEQLGVLAGPVPSPASR